MSSPSRDPQELERRVIDLEVGIAFQARTIEALDAVVREFAARVEALERRLTELTAGDPSETPWAVPGGKDGEEP